MKSAFAVVAVLVGLCSMATGGDSDGKTPKKFKITTKRGDDAVETRSDLDKTVFAVKSPFGISQMVIERLEDDWPKVVALRLHLKGLEHFQIANGKFKLDGSVAVRDGKVETRLWRDGNEKAVLGKDSPVWVDVRVVGGDGKPATALPLKTGFIEITLPKTFFEGSPKSITVSWIDFYRG